MSLVLQFELPSLVELAHLFSNMVGCRFIFKVFSHYFLQVIGHKSKRFRNGRSWSLAYELIPELVLDARLLSEDWVGLDVENAVITLV